VDPLLPTLYDGLDRLKQVKSANQWGLASYSYDPLDNLRTNQLGATTLTYSYDAGNRLSSLTNGLGSTWAITTDGRGNITANALKAQAYQFDLAHRMSAVTGKESCLYDGHGRRARTLNLQTGTIEYYGYGQDGRLLQDWSNRRQVRNGYVYLGNTVVGLYEVNLTNGTVTPRYQHTDALGSPVVTTNAGKTVLSRMSYTPYGLPTLPMDGVGYTGHFMDVGTQLTYMQQRYYDPQIGRFLSTDPVPAQRSTGENFNRFAYARANPLSFKDPDGRWACRGSTADCDQFAAALEAVKKAAKNTQNSAKTRATLNAVTKFYGARNQRNGVVVSATGGASYGLASTHAGETASGRTWAAVSFNAKNMADATKGVSQAEKTNIYASVLVHEFGHGTDRENNYGLSWVRSERVGTEVKAFTGEAHFGLASGYDFGGLIKNGSIDYGEINRQAEAAAELTCKIGWSCL
jgi:RHS repeat-associated protein